MNHEINQFREMVAAQPGNHQAWNALAWAHIRSGEPELGVEYARRAHDMQRQNIDYLNTIGVAQAELGDLAAAEATFKKALRTKPLFVDILINLAKVLDKQEKRADSLKLLQRAHVIEPDFPNLTTSLARTYRDLGRAEEAKLLLQSARGGVEEQDLLMALAACDFELNGVPAAIERLREGTSQHPDWRLARLSLAHLLLGSGHWRDGWEQYLWRIDRREPPKSLPERLDGARIVLRGEQGIGDVLFFLRFAPKLRERGARLTLVCEKKLLAILNTQGPLEAIRGVDGELAGETALLLGDLPAVLQFEDTPSAWPFSVVDDERRAARERLLALGPPPYLGITWRAGTDLLRGREFGGDRTALMKAVPPQALGNALRGWPGTVIVLQRAARPDEETAFRATMPHCHDLSVLGDDLRSLLALLAVLDEYVAVSNANVHLLAGLGLTARILVPYPGEWRWMWRGGALPWFPHCATYRQPRSRDWSEPLAQLRRDLRL